MALIQLLLQNPMCTYMCEPYLAQPKGLSSLACRSTAAQSPTPLAVLGAIHLERVTDLSWSRDGSMLAASSYDGFVRWEHLAHLLSSSAICPLNPMSISYHLITATRPDPLGGLHVGRAPLLALLSLRPHKPGCCACRPPAACTCAQACSGPLAGGGAEIQLRLAFGMCSLARFEAGELGEPLPADQLPPHLQNRQQTAAQQQQTSRQHSGGELHKVTGMQEPRAGASPRPEAQQQPMQVDPAAAPGQPR